MAGSELTIRKLSLEDALPLVRVSNQAFLEHARFADYGVQSVARIADCPGWQWGAFRGGELLAFVLNEPRPEKGHVAIRLIAVLPGAGKGIGSRLLAAVEAQARAEGFPALRVGTPFARGFYEKNGFHLAKTDLKMIRDIACQALPPEPESAPAMRLLGFPEAAAVLPRLEGDALRRAFLSAFLGNARRDGGLALLLGEPERPQGVAVGRVPELYRDFVEVVFHHAFGNELAPLVRAFERRVSALGLRYVGLEVPEDREREFEALGYSRAERDFYWTMYTLEKALKG
jgi:GNAT superfamily N-acetyltransferase